MKKEVISFRQKVKAGEKVRFSERVKYDGFIEGLNVRFYAGQEQTLLVYPYVLHKGKKTEDFITTAQGTDSFLSGDDDYFQYPVTLKVEYDDEIYVYAENNSIDEVNQAGFEYSLVVDVVINYYDESLQTGEVK